jgi:hypothetical protein
MSSTEAMLDQLHERIHGLMDTLPPEDWTVTEAAAVVDVLAGLIASREGKSQFC